MESKKVKNIELVFENCDFAKVDISHIEFMSMRSVSPCMYITQCHEIDEHLYSPEVHILISKEANIDKADNSFGKYGDQYYLFDRLHNEKDVTQITINYEDGQEKTILVDWEDCNLGGECNIFQNSTITPDGNLMLNIGRVIDEKHQ